MRNSVLLISTYIGNVINIFGKKLHRLGLKLTLCHIHKYAMLTNGLIPH